MTQDSQTPQAWPQVRAALALFSKPFPREAVALAVAHRDEVAPHLVAELEALAANPSQAPKDFMLHIYAMQLLGWWRDERGLAPLVSLGRMTDHGLLDELFGDHLTESYGRCLGSMARGKLGPLKALAEDPYAYVWARGAALEAIKTCVIEGDAARDEVIAYARALAEREAAASRAGRAANEWGYDFLNAVVDLLTDLRDDEALPAIRAWSDEGLLDEGSADPESIEGEMAEPFEQAAQHMLEDGDGYVGDPDSEMSWWACFTEDDDEDGDDGDFDVGPAHQPYVRETPKIGRNDPCPCGSGKKYKKCHGAVA